ncbi:MAG: rod shape-determining protein MreC [Candidatus Buchananbacteria bacterium RIFCSPLOWO2_01_FULL_46_12]|uniref:Cell shape-determining protein MreC n=2 Tax=Candidatus Buchananiibacteriota TaxID=1817903 RepID=A0A1G1YNF7_9BACT|nr:MAG: rod shape-determining protein MreC [Candidatus Buchananbacteria bacterium RIFCSPHIGHO2_01_FULL_44_11]OGY53893.1 MAG: rod shape-determining protein MreC [Candidatus Buchananbacteria bacterium RIFCSPLOWO2_01_FULL_46_12]
MIRLFRRQFNLTIILLAVAVLLIFLHYVKILTPVENLLIKVFSPVQSSVYSLGVKFRNFYSQTSFNQDLETANQQLLEQVRQLTIENAQLKVTLVENFQIKNQTDFLSQNGLSAVIAKVIGKGLFPDSQILIINKGSRDGVQVDLPIIAQDGLIVGKVIEVSAELAKAILINDSQSSLAVTVQNQTQTKGVVTGEHGLSLKMELIPETEIIQVGDMVVTSGLELNIPRGLLVGQIETLESEPNSFFKVAYLRSLINFDDLTVVSVLKTSQP